MPPYVASWPNKPPSIKAVPPGTLMVAFPKITNPPQSPYVFRLSDCADVNTMGWVGVPSAIILLPRVIIKVPLDALSPKIVVPGWIVNVAPFFTNTNPLKI